MKCLEHAIKQAILASTGNIANILAWLSPLMFLGGTMCVGKRIESVVYCLLQQNVTDSQAQSSRAFF